MINNDPVPVVVPAGRMAALEQPVLALPSGLELRPWRPEDADALAAAGQDPDIRQWNRFAVASPQDARDRIRRMHERWQAEQAAIWAVAPAGGGEAQGLVGWGHLDLEEGGAEIVYWLLPAARGRGVAVEAARAAGRWAFEELGLHRLTLCHSVANPASCRVADRAGYTLEGTMRSALLHADGWHDQHLHSLVADDR
ncbi:GNAT family N-acetyltransferase [Kitasatospora sp. NPDC059646]|uniref:GNAT family N-acetyltransferase n=1 Tax=Kitasatospora sp. NPDC059646 TaxID=3346893 RepID=UPI00368E97C9